MLKEILDTYMKEENLLSLSGLAERLDIPYKKLEKIIRTDLQAWLITEVTL